MPKKTFLWGIILVAAAVLIFPVQARALSLVEGRRALDRAASYLLTQEKTQGKPLSPWSYVALAAAGKSLAGTRAEEACRRQLAFLEQSAPPATADYCLLMLALIAAGENPYDYHGLNIVQKIQVAQLSDGKFADNIDGGGQGDNGEQILINAHIWAVLALHAAGAEIPDAAKARQWLVARQHADGSFNWCAGEDRPDVDSTGMALMALGALGERGDSPVVQKAVAYLQSVQENDGGFTSWGAANPESCNMVIQGLLAVGIDPAGAIMSKPGGNPVTAMLRFQLPDGSFAHIKGAGANEMATQQALLALAGVTSGKTPYTVLREKIKLPPGVPAPAAREIRFRVGVRDYVEADGKQRRVKQVDAAPFIANGRTYVPVRYLALALGVPEEGISWSPSTQVVTLRTNAQELTLTIGRAIMSVNGTARPPMDVAPLLRDGRVYMPARYVAEAFGFRVRWEESSQTVVIVK